MIGNRHFFLILLTNEDRLSTERMVFYEVQLNGCEDRSFEWIREVFLILFKKKISNETHILCAEKRGHCMFDPVSYNNK
jgi:hypothetical protein